MGGIVDENGRADGGEGDLSSEDFLLKLARTRMPFGKYAGRLLIDLPEAYVVWFARKGWPEGEIGFLLENLYTIKENGLEYLLRPLSR